MEMNDMILVSVDDHVCEPPDMWKDVLPEKWKSRAPKLVTRADGSDVWVFEGQQIPNVGLNAVAGRPPEEYGMEPTALSQLRKGCYDVDARIEDMNANGVLGSLCFPSVPGFCGELFGRNAGQGAGPGDDPGLQRLAHRRLVRRPSRPLHSAGDPDDVGPEAAGRRGAPGGEEGLPRHLLRRLAEGPRPPEPAQRVLGARSGRPAPTRAP